MGPESEGAPDDVDWTKVRRWVRSRECIVERLLSELANRSPQVTMLPTQRPSPPNRATIPIQVATNAKAIPSKTTTTPVQMSMTRQALKRTKGSLDLSVFDAELTPARSAETTNRFSCPEKTKGRSVNATRMGGRPSVTFTTPAGTTSLAM